MAVDDVSIGELGRRLDRLDNTLKEVRQEIHNQQFVHRDVLAEILVNIQKDQDAQWKAIQEINERDRRRTGWIVTGLLLPVILIVILQYLQLSS